MSLTTILLKQETKNKLRSLANKSESFDSLLNRLYENEIDRMNSEVFFGADTLSLYEALKEIDIKD